MATENPVHTLIHEHVYILKVIHALGVIGEDLEQDRKVDQSLFEPIVRFMREFADKCHHAKEEAVLFPAMEDKGVPKTGCPLSALRSEHVRGRELVSKLETSAAALAGGNESVRDTLCEVIRHITELYPNHIWKEDAMVFPMTENMFTKAELSILTSDFEKAESEYGQNHDHYISFANDLEARFGTPSGHTTGTQG